MAQSVSFESLHVQREAKITFVSYKVKVSPS